MKRLIFTLTGISLLDEKKELLGNKRSYNTICDNIDSFDDRVNDIIINDTLRTQKNDVLNALSERILRDEISSFSAEIASLCYLKAIDNKEDKIIFISSDTAKCAFAGVVNGKYIIFRRTNTKKWDSITFNASTSNSLFSCDNIEIKIIKGLQVKDGNKFVSQGIKNLFYFIDNKIKEEGGEYDEVILNITGGYKGTIPYISLFGMLFQEREIKGKKIKPSIRYLFEDTEKILKLPNLPIAYDIFTWRNYRGFLKAIPHIENNVAEIILNKILPSQASDLFEKGKNNKYHLTALGEVINNNYREEKEGELTPYGRGYLLLDRINDNTKQKALQDCINRWQYLWLGDQIPETVEHARGHTQRILELAAQILYPIFNDGGKIFNNDADDNLLAFISAIWLHDLGHSGDHIKWQNDENKETIEYEIKGFPSLIRELHHMLSCRLIDKDKKELFKSRDEKDEWKWNDTIFSEELIKSIQQICLYHRSRMPVSDIDKNDGFVGLKVTKHLEELHKDVVNIPLLGALLRIVDAGDVQEERTISKNYTAMRFLQNDREKERLLQEEKKYREIIDDSFDKYSGCKVPDYLNYLKENAIKYFNHETIENFDTQVNECVQSYIQGKDLENINVTGKIILRNWLNTLDQYMFKTSTSPHFKKHGGINAIMYLLNEHDTKNGSKNEYHYKVLAIQEKDDDEEKKTANSVLEDIQREYLSVKKILNEHYIFFDSYEAMEEETGKTTITLS